MTNEDILAIAREVFDYEFKSDAQGQRLITFARRIQQEHRAVMEQALDALELAHPRFGIGTVKYNEALASLKEALK